jgi:hypothetical protein
MGIIQQVTCYPLEGEQMTEKLQRIIVSIYSSDNNLLLGDLSRRLDGLEWWITDRQSIELGEETIRVIDTTKWKEEGQE